MLKSHHDSQNRMGWDRDACMAEQLLTGPPDPFPDSINKLLVKPMPACWAISQQAQQTG